MTFSSLPLTLALMQATSSSTVALPTADPLQPGHAIAVHQLHYRKLYEEKPFPDARLVHYDNGMYRITSEGEDHWGVYVLQGAFDDQTFTVRYISLPSPDWGNRTAFHQLTFIQDSGTAGFFIQDAITDKGEAIPQQNGTYAWRLPHPRQP